METHGREVIRDRPVEKLVVASLTAKKIRTQSSPLKIGKAKHGPASGNRGRRATASKRNRTTSMMGPISATWCTLHPRTKLGTPGLAFGGTDRRNLPTCTTWNTLYPKYLGILRETSTSRRTTPLMLPSRTKTLGSLGLAYVAGLAPRKTNWEMGTPLTPPWVIPKETHSPTRRISRRVAKMGRRGRARREEAPASQT